MGRRPLNRYFIVRLFVLCLFFPIGIESFSSRGGRQSERHAIRTFGRLGSFQRERWLRPRVFVGIASTRRAEDERETGTGANGSSRQERTDTSTAERLNEKQGDECDPSQKISKTAGEEGEGCSKLSTRKEGHRKEPQAFTEKEVGGYDPSEKIGGKEINVGDPQIKVKKKERSVTSILRQLAAIQQQGPQKYCILGTRHCSFLHQQIIELLAYALVLSGNHVYTSGAGGTHAATIRGALRAERPDLLTVVLPQSMSKQTKESRELLKDVEDVVTMPQNDEMSLDVASRICNSYLLSQTDQLISFAFHESSTVIEATKEAKELDMLVTVLYLD